MKTTKLYELKRGDLFIIPDAANAKIPPASNLPEEETFRFDHVDGMYSFCTVVGGKYAGAIVHPAAWTEVKKVEHSA